MPYQVSGAISDWTDPKPQRQTRSLALLFAAIFYLAASVNAAEPTLEDVWSGKAQFEVEQSAALVWK